MALYLKYRPLDFTSLVGQEFIKTTLKAAVSKDKTVGAYMFTGPRWTGKTSTARIFAKAINCESSKDGDPCLECSICQAFANESLIDVIEIDAASHTWVDNIREIIEKAQFRPTSAAYKIYIIDEVHMLSKGAFNALLKILEEPPKHVKFILATTEIHKVPDTILSRCQRYDFKNFTDSEIIGRLEYIAGEEGITVDEKSYGYIVKNSEGWMRNAVSLFEQLIKDNTISYDHIVETLWVASEDEKKIFISKLLSMDSSLLDDFEQLVKSGRDIKNFFKQILSDFQKETVRELQNGQDIRENIRVMELLSDMLMKSKNSFDPSIIYKIGIMKIVSWYSENIPTQEVVQAKPSQLQTPTKKQVETKPQIKKELEIADAEDVFAAAKPQSPEIKDISGIDVDALIAATKKHGWKAALSMTLKWASFHKNGSNLEIQTKTKIALATLSKWENRDCLFLALKEMEIEVEDIIVS